MLRRLRQFLDDTAGVSAVEYGLMLGLVLAGTVVSVKAIGVNLSTLFGTIANGFH
jgi:pilus assembly protein Flp/PilA